MLIRHDVLGFEHCGVAEGGREREVQRRGERRRRGAVGAETARKVSVVRVDLTRLLRVRERGAVACVRLFAVEDSLQRRTTKQGETRDKDCF